MSVLLLVPLDIVPNDYEDHGMETTYNSSDGRGYWISDLGLDRSTLTKTESSG